MELETLFRDLVAVLRAKDPSWLHQPHRLRDIQYGLIPYRSVRDALGLTCSEDHEMLLLRLCSGEGDFFEISDPDAFQALQVEADGVNPDLSLLQVYGEVNVLLGSEAVERVLSGPDAARATEFAPPGEEEAHDERHRVTDQFPAAQAHHRHHDGADEQPDLRQDEPDLVEHRLAVNHGEAP